MSNTTKLLLVSIVLYFVSSVCFTSDYLIIIALGVVLRFVGMFFFIVWFLIFIGTMDAVQELKQRCCPLCTSRHYIAYSRGSKFGFAFPARFVKVSKTDFHCQDCGHDWSMTEEDERDAHT